MKTKHTIEVEVEWDVDSSIIPHKITAKHLPCAWWIDEANLEDLGITKPEPPYVPPVGDVVIVDNEERLVFVGRYGVVDALVTRVVGCAAVVDASPNQARVNFDDEGRTMGHFDFAELTKIGRVDS